MKMKRALKCIGAIIAVKKYGVTDEVIQKVLKEFKGVEHRLEYVDTINGVTYYNDSKATNCVSTITALNSFNQPTILLLGGYDRGHSFHDLDDSMKNVKCVVCFGETKNRIEEFCNDLNIKCYKNDTLKEAMNVVKDICTPGDVVLLSPACASWDQYDRFEDRGDGKTKGILPGKYAYTGRSEEHHASGTGVSKAEKGNVQGRQIG